MMRTISAAEQPSARRRAPLPHCAVEIRRGKKAPARCGGTALRLHVSHSSRLGNFLEAAGPLFDAPFADGLLHTLPASEVEQGIWRAQTRVYHFNAAVGAWEVGCQLNNHGSHHCDSLTVRIVGSPSTRSLSAVHTCRVAGS